MGRKYRRKFGLGALTPGRFKLKNTNRLRILICFSTSVPENPLKTQFFSLDCSFINQFFQIRPEKLTITEISPKEFVGAFDADENFGFRGILEKFFKISGAFGFENLEFYVPKIPNVLEFGPRGARGCPKNISG